MADNAEAEQLERAEKVRYGSEIGRGTATTRQETLYALYGAIVVHTRCAPPLRLIEPIVFKRKKMSL